MVVDKWAKIWITSLHPTNPQQIAICDNQTKTIKPSEKNQEKEYFCGTLDYRLGEDPNAFGHQHRSRSTQNQTKTGKQKRNHGTQKSNLRYANTVNNHNSEVHFQESEVSHRYKRDQPTRPYSRLVVPDSRWAFPVPWDFFRPVVLLLLLSANCTFW